MHFRYKFPIQFYSNEPGYSTTGREIFQIEDVGADTFPELNVLFVSEEAVNERLKK